MVITGNGERGLIPEREPEKRATTSKDGSRRAITHNPLLWGGSDKK